MNPRQATCFSDSWTVMHRGTISVGGSCLVLVGLLTCGCRQQESHETASPLGSEVAGITESRSASETPVLRFRLRGSECNIDARHFSGITDDRYYPASLGSGLAFVDLELDGLPDLLLATACPLPVPEQSEDFRTRLYRNSGAWHFREASREAGLGFDGFAAGITAADADNDGFPDFYLNCLGSNCLYHNEGDGTFSRWSSAASEFSGFGASAGFFDADGDGTLDLYVCQYGEWSIAENKWCGDPVKKIRAFCHPREIAAASDRFFRNGGDGSFEDVTDGSAVAARKMRALGVIAGHFNDDGLIDIFVANDGQPNCLYLNSGAFRFEEVAELRGCAVDGNGRPQGNMGVAVSDFDRNTLPDIFVTNYSGEPDTLYRNLGNGSFFDDSRASGSAVGSVPLVGWGTSFADFDADGWEDLIVANGHVDWNMQYLGDETPYKQPLLVYSNSLGRLTPVAAAIAPKPVDESSRGLVIGDIDGDLDADVAISRQDAVPMLLDNVSHQVFKVFSFRLKGRRSNRDSIGARIFRSGSPPVYREIYGGGSILSTSTLDVLIADEPTGDGGIEIVWPNGWKSMLSDLQAGTRFVVLEPDSIESNARIYTIPE